jgi:conjugative transfer signal peptidase TraF
VSRAAWLRATVIAATLTTTLFLGAAWQHPTPRLLWNASASAPLGLYRVFPDGPGRAGQMVAIRPPAKLASFLAERRYLAPGIPLLKHVASEAGGRICRRGLKVSLNGRLVATALKLDSRNRPLPVWHGCHRLAAGELFLLNPAPDSMDGRYFGALPASGLIGRAIPLLTRDTPSSPLLWRGWNAPPPIIPQRKG